MKPNVLSHDALKSIYNARHNFVVSDEEMPSHNILVLEICGGLQRTGIMLDAPMLLLNTMMNIRGKDYYVIEGEVVWDALKSGIALEASDVFQEM